MNLFDLEAILLRRRFFSLLLLLLLPALSGCGSDQPPMPQVTAGKVVVPTVLGSYCWKSTFAGRCADTPAPVDLLKAVRYEAPVLAGGTVLHVGFSVPPSAGPITVNQWVDGKPVAVQLGEPALLVLPKEPGVYSYDLSARWKQGSGSYAFQVEVR